MGVIIVIPFTKDDLTCLTEGVVCVWSAGMVESGCSGEDSTGDLAAGPQGWLVTHLEAVGAHNACRSVLEGMRKEGSHNDPT